MGRLPDGEVEDLLLQRSVARRHRRESQVFRLLPKGPVEEAVASLRRPLACLSAPEDPSRTPECARSVGGVARPLFDSGAITISGVVRLTPPVEDVSPGTLAHGSHSCPVQKDLLSVFVKSTLHLESSFRLS